MMDHGGSSGSRTAFESASKCLLGSGFDMARACGITVIQNRSSVGADMDYGSRAGLTRCGENSASTISAMSTRLLDTARTAGVAS